LLPLKRTTNKKCVSTYAWQLGVFFCGNDKALPLTKIELNKMIDPRKKREETTEKVEIFNEKKKHPKMIY